MPKHPSQKRYAYDHPAGERQMKRKKKKKSSTLKYFMCAFLTLVLALMGYVYFGVYRPMTAPIAVVSDDDGIILQDEELTVTQEDLIYVDPKDLSANVDLGDEVINILLLGADSRKSGSYGGLTDTVIILSVNPTTYEIKMTSILRDTWVTIPGRKNKQKINAANVFGGPNLAIKTINETFDMNIEDYVIFNFESVTTVVDSIGGIDIAVTEAEMKQVNKNLDGHRWDLNQEKASYKNEDFAYLTEYGGSVHLNGHQALAYARIRKIDSDYVRIERQRTVILAIGEKVRSSSALQIGSLATQLFPYVSTSLGLQEIITLANVGMNTDFDNIGQMQLPVQGTFKSGTYNGVWCIRPDFAKNKKLLREFIYGDE